MNGSPWLADHPQTSANAAAAAKRSLRASVIVLVVVFAGAVVEAFLLQTDPLGLVAIGAAVIAFQLASAQVSKEAYHRLVAEGK